MTDSILPRPYEGSGDRGLVDGCLLGDDEAWSELRRRHGSLVSATVVRAIDGPRAEETDIDGLLAIVWDRVRGDALAQWSGESQVRTYLSVIARHVTRSHVPSEPGQLVAAYPTPSGLFLDDLLALEPAARVQEAIERLPPNVAALVRLRVEGLTRDDIAATLGMSPQAVLHNLVRIAGWLGDRDETEPDTARCWRILLDAAAPAERVVLAVETADDPEFARVRSMVEKTWRAVGRRALSREIERTPDCLDERATAGFVDGTLRGADRARAEGHVGSCPLCIDEAAALVLDLRSSTVLRDAAAFPPIVAVTAACVATARFAAAERLARRAVELGLNEVGPGNRVLADLRRLAQAGRHLQGGDVDRPEPTSRVVATHVPADDEAPLIAFEALVLEDPRTAWRAIDDHLAKQGLHGRLRMLAAAAGYDLSAAGRLADAQLSSPRRDPAHALDAELVAALPEGVALPREILVERLRSILPDAVRFVLTRPSA